MFGQSRWIEAFRSMDGAYWTWYGFLTGDDVRAIPGDVDVSCHCAHEISRGKVCLIAVLNQTYLHGYYAWSDETLVHVYCDGGGQHALGVRRSPRVV